MARDGTGREPAKGLTEAQRAYEARRAAKAGVPLERWLERKAAESRVPAAAAGAAPARKPGLLSRLLERAQKPL